MKIIWILTVLCAAQASDVQCPQLIIAQGKLQGKFLKSNSGRTIYAYLGIPFAKPPVGNLRFKPPAAAKPWIGTLEATNLHPICVQRNYITGDGSITGEENCLFLNVYTPELLSQSSTMPVMIYFHSGGFILGNANYDSYGPEVLLDKDVVLVVPNYRLGALGFLSTGDKVLPGNNGLKDQYLAIKWVKDNIRQFGGDPEKITLFGSSAGGASAHLHMLSPMTKDLINGAILQSGTAISAWALSLNGENQRNTKKLAEHFHCSTSNSAEMVECLQNVGAYKLTNADTLFHEWRADPIIPFKVVVEPDVKGAFLTQHPIDVIKSGKVAKIPFMLGITSEDGCMKSPGIFGQPGIVEDLHENFTRVVPVTLQYNHIAPDKDIVSERIREFYFGKDVINELSKDAVTDMYTDDMFLSTAQEIAQLHLKYTNEPVYYYVFGYRGQFSHNEIFGDPTYDYGVCHADEGLYLFPLSKSYINGTLSGIDKVISEKLTGLWTNFASTGNPTPENDFSVTSTWSPVQTENLEYYFIKNVTDMTMKKNPYWKRFLFWKDLPINRLYNYSNW